MSELTIDKTVFRRYMMGRQGLWPGRRWVGKEGAAAAITALGGLQMDSVTVVARSHELVLWSRVAGYRAEYFDELLYKDRRFFDHGGTLTAFPMAELPYWRMVMRRLALEPRRQKTAQEHASIIDELRSMPSERWPLGNRDFEGNARVNSYRSGKDTGLALYYLWLTGDLMTHHRRGFERMYAPLDMVAPSEFNYEASPEEAEEYFAHRASKAPITARQWRLRFAWLIGRSVAQAEAKERIAALVEGGELTPVRVESHKDPYLFPTDQLVLLETLASGEVPAEWKPADSTTADEAILLSPLDPVVAHGRADELFGFYYIWEIYKPAEKRRWGYYTMPILYGDRLVARLDPRLDRKSATLVVNGIWLEPDTAADEPFVAALGRGLANFAAFHNATQVDLSAVERPLADGLRSVIAETAQRS